MSASLILCIMIVAGISLTSTIRYNEIDMSGPDEPLEPISRDVEITEFGNLNGVAIAFGIIGGSSLLGLTVLRLKKDY